MTPFENVFSRFSSLYKEKLEHLYPSACFQIKFVSQENESRLADATRTPFAINPYCPSQIVFNQSLIVSIGLCDEEIWACIAHEIGHFVKLDEIVNYNYCELIKEQACDQVAIELGLQFNLASALIKMSSLIPKDDLHHRLEVLINQIVLYRPEWTCGRYNPEKHAAIYYNLIAGMCYCFEEDSADVVGTIFQRGRNASIHLDELVRSVGINNEEIIPFLAQLLEIGLIVDSPITAEGVADYRKRMAGWRKEQKAKPLTIKDKLPFEHTNAEKDYSDISGGISVMFELTYNCSEKCIHCYNIGATRNEEEISHRGDLKEMELEDYIRLIDEFIEMGLYKVCLSGGDPFSKPIVWEIIDYLYKNEVAFDVFTNGQLLEGHEERLAGYYPRLVGVSIYSGEDAIHDYVTRKKGSLKRSLGVMRKLRDLSVPMNLKCCVMRPNMKSYHTVLKIAEDVGAVPQFEVSITDSIDGDKCASHFLRLRPEELEVVLRDSNVPLYVGPEIPEYGRVKRDMGQNACGAGYNSFCVTPDGKLIPCCAFHLELGDLNHTSISAILTQSKVLKQWKNLTLKDYSDCGKKDYCDYCNLCPGNNYSQMNDPRFPGENNCYVAKIRQNLSDKVKSGKDVLNNQSVQERISEFDVRYERLRRIFDKE